MDKHGYPQDLVVSKRLPYWVVRETMTVIVYKSVDFLMWMAQTEHIRESKQKSLTGVVFCTNLHFLLNNDSAPMNGTYLFVTLHLTSLKVNILQKQEPRLLNI